MTDSMLLQGDSAELIAGPSGYIVHGLQPVFVSLEGYEGLHSPPQWIQAAQIVECVEHESETAIEVTKGHIYRKTGGTLADLWRTATTTPGA